MLVRVYVKCFYKKKKKKIILIIFCEQLIIREELRISESFLHALNEVYVLLKSQVYVRSFISFEEELPSLQSS